MTPRRFLSLVLFLSLSFAALASEPFEIREGDRVLFLGDTLLERETTYGYLETRMQEQFPDRHFTVRNLSWAGETPRGWSRASFDPPEKGWDRLKENIAEVKPTVVFLGFGMAASLQEMTDRSADITLNPDPVRYGAEPMSAARFKKELGELMDAIGKDVRFVLLAPIPHEDLRASKPGLPDPTEHNKLLEQYSKAIEELATERSGQYVSTLRTGIPVDAASGKPLVLTDNGIHLTESGYAVFGDSVATQLGWKTHSKLSGDPQHEPLRLAVTHKNELFFNRFRPANSTYLFGFRKHEQGQNAKEIPMFDPLIEAAEAEIDRLKRIPADAKVAAAQKAMPTNPVAGQYEPPPLPDFTVEDGYQIELWAQNPFLEKPTQMNWDPLGRLWVCSSSLYPMIEPGQPANDKILILEDPERVGKAAKSTVFADGLLIPTGVAPDLVKTEKGLVPAACYVGQSTELLYFSEPDANGKATKKRIVFSGFGTEDTHHIVHTLHWGPDGRLFFHQSVYIHTHLETPWGMVRLNSGGVFAYDPRTERVEVFAKGLWNTWGQQEDDWGQTFLTDGAGSTGLSWAFPGAVFAPFEGSRRQMASISPGSYPKFCGLEIIKSPHFPAEWQGNAITCDFRAHRVVRFGFTDLALAKDPKSGFVTTEMPDLIRTTDLSFRPIDVKMGPDGALYIADWSNPVINHGEVDFRDPRRDHHMGRIWRVTKKDTPALKWEPLLGERNEELLDKLLSKSAWEKQQARRAVASRGREAIRHDLESWMISRADVPARLEAMWLYLATGMSRPADKSLDGPDPLKPRHKYLWELGDEIVRSSDPQARAIAARVQGVLVTEFPPSSDRGQKGAREGAIDLLDKLTADPSPRVRLEVMRAIGRDTDQNQVAAEIALDGVVREESNFAKQPSQSPNEKKQKQKELVELQNIPDDPFYDFAAWQSINDLAKPWTEAIASGAWKTEGHEKQLEYGLKSIDPALAGATISQLFAAGKVPVDGSGPWFEILGAAGGPAELQPLWDGLLVSYAGDCCETDETRALQGHAPVFRTDELAHRALEALLAAARVRQVHPALRVSLAPALFHAKEPLRTGAVELAGLWHVNDSVEELSKLLGAQDLTPELRHAIFQTARMLGTPEARKLIDTFLGADVPVDARREAALALAGYNIKKAATVLPAVFAQMPDENAAVTYWRQLLAIKGSADALAGALPKDFPKPAANAGVRAAREAGRAGAKLLAALGPIAGLNPAETKTSADYATIAANTKQNGDPAKGELVYRRAASACTTCHSIGGAGGKVGPDLTSIGASAPLDYLVESVLDPNAKVKEGFNAVSFALSDGTQVTGIQSRETANEFFLRDATGAEHAVPKAQVTGKTNIGSIMPPGLTATMSPRDQLDLYAFLGELGRPGPYDASKGSVARVWRLYPGTAAGEVVSAAFDPTKNPGFPGYTLVDGRFVKDLLAEATMIAASGSDTVLLATQFQSTGKTRLDLTGAEKAWLDAQPLAIGGEIAPELPGGTHTLVVKIGVKELPTMLRVESPDARFLGN